MLRYLMAYPKKNFSYPGLSMWFSNRINWIISDVQAKKFFLIIFLASNKVLAMLGSWIGTCSVFFHSYSVSPGVICHEVLTFFQIDCGHTVLRQQNKRKTQNSNCKYRDKWIRFLEASLGFLSFTKTGWMNRFSLDLVLLISFCKVCTYIT